MAKLELVLVLTETVLAAVAVELESMIAAVADEMKSVSKRALSIILFIFYINYRSVSQELIVTDWLQESGGLKSTNSSLKVLSWTRETF